MNTDRGMLGVSLCVLMVAAVSTFFDSAIAQVGPSVDPLLADECNRLGIDLSECNESAILAAQPIILTAFSVGHQERAFEAKITWTPPDIGQPNKFHVEIFDANQLEPRSPVPVSYDMRIYKGDKYLLPPEGMGNSAELNEDFSQDFTFVFLEEGSYVLTIGEIEQEGGNISLPIQVTPEFPFGLFACMAGLIASIIATTRISFKEVRLSRRS